MSEFLPEAFPIKPSDQPDTMTGSGLRLGYDHQSMASLVSLPDVLNVSERGPFRVYVKVPFCGVRHHLLKGFDQNVASWNRRSTQKC